jgi:hypothetical protein
VQFSLFEINNHFELFQHFSSSARVFRETSRDRAVFIRCNCSLERIPHVGNIQCLFMILNREYDCDCAVTLQDLHKDRQNQSRCYNYYSPDLSLDI